MKTANALCDPIAGAHRASAYHALFFNKGDCPAFRVTASLYLHSALFSRTCETFACLQTAADMPAASDRNYSSVSSG